MIDNEQQLSDTGPSAKCTTHGSKRMPSGANARGGPVRPDAAKNDRLPAYERWTRERLYAHARTVGIKGRSSMNKQQLIDALRKSCH